MIPRDDEFDVYVSEGVLLEVWRGPRISLAQQFSEDWDGPVQSMTHPAAFRPASAPGTLPNHMTRQQIRAIVRRGWRWLAASVALGIGIGTLLVYVLEHAWRL